MFLDNARTDEEDSTESIIPAEMKITSWNVSLIVIFCAEETEYEIDKHHLSRMTFRHRKLIQCIHENIIEENKNLLASCS